MSNPLADRIRPKTIDEVVGQKHLLGEDKLLNKIIKKGEIPNMIFYGPSGVGKTTVANIISQNTGKRLYRLNATTASVSDVKNIIDSLDSFLTPNGVLLYLDEIQHFNKKQQQSLLEFMENGKITLIASTTENPYFYIYNAVLSRSVVFEFKPIEPCEVLKAVKRGVDILANEEFKSYNFTVSDDAMEHMAQMSGGDVRKALNSLEVAAMAAVPKNENTIEIDLDLAVQATQRSTTKYDKSGDNHYDILSAFQKSIRGSDPDAAIHYLARLVAGGDLQIICRRLLVIAAEDIGLAYPQAITVVKACVDSALQLGFPEARIPLAEAVILLATAPKSNSANEAICAAMSDIESIDVGEIPAHLKDAHYGGAKSMGRGIEYKYPHLYENHYVEQQYLPDKIKNKKYYKYGDNKTEKSMNEYWIAVKKAGKSNT